MSRPPPILASGSPLILASGSPRRKDLLREAGVAIEIIVSDVPEVPGSGESPEAVVRRLSGAKAQAVAVNHPDRWVLGADTDVSVDGEILGKPADAADAARLLGKIQGRAHEVWGAFTLVNRARGVLYCESHKTSVEIAPLSSALIDWYVKTGEPLDKAGAYGAQGIGAQFITAVTGSYSNVVGLNIAAVMNALRKHGIVA